MKSMNQMVRKLQDRKGQGMTEYIIIAILIAIVVLIAVRQLGTNVKGQFEKARDEVKGLGPTN
jgi:Flp pilus assembly pilin Flp